MIQVEKEISTNSLYFYIKDLPPATTSGSTNVSRICILWDASHSRADTDKQKEFQVIETLVRKYPSKVRIDIFTFSDFTDFPTTFNTSECNHLFGIIVTLIIIKVAQKKLLTSSVKYFTMVLPICMTPC